MKRFFRKGVGVIASIALAVGTITSMVTPGIVASGASLTDNNFSSVGGFNESIYAQITGIKDADVTGVSYTGTSSGTLTGQDLEYLVRDKNNGVRIDIPGVTPGTYTLTVTTKNGTITKSGITVDAQDRSGYAHFNYTEGVGAYNDDGTLKNNAIVLYVTDENKNDVTLTYGGVTVKGIGNILNSVGKACGEAGHETDCKKVSDGKTYYAKGNTNQGIIEKLAEAGIPLDIRFIGTVSDSGLYKRGTFDLKSNRGLIDGLTAYDSNDFGGSDGDNGHMARIKSGKDITLEGIGTDAVIDGWGFHYMSESAKPDLGKSFEVRNLTFINTPEDAIGMEGVQEKANVSSDLSASVERCWIHNNEFYCPDVSSPAESDKSEGDGSVDFKRGQYFTCSYNYFEGCHKTNLVGSSDASLQFNLTYHHNYWKLCKARGPLTRNANVHMYNNIFEGQTDYAMNVRVNAYIFSEYNLFYMSKNPQRDDTDAGVIKSYNDSFSSCIGSMDGVKVTDKSQTVDNKCRFAARNIDYSKFDTDSNLSYIPTGDYQLQTSITEARKVIESKTGVLNENPVAASDVTMSQISYLPSGVTPENITSLPTTLTPGKVSKTVYAFTVGGTVDVTINYASDALSDTGVLVNEAGESFLIASGTAVNLPAGTYMIQPYNVQAGDGKKMQNPTFKTVTINSIEIRANDPNAHYHDFKLVSTTDATCDKEGSKIYECSCGEKKIEIIAKTAHKYGEWVIEKEATETETGIKSRTCTVCNNKETQTIPVKGTVDPTPTPTPGGTYSYNFTSPETGSDIYKIKGNTSTSKGSVQYAGLTLTTCLKMEGSTSVDFTAPSDGTLTLVFGANGSAVSGKKVKVNETVYTCDSDGIVTVPVKAGSVSITKGEAIFLFYMNYEPDSTTPDPTPDPDPMPDPTPTPEVKNGLQKADDGNYYYYVDGKVDTSFTDIIPDGDDWVYVENGKVNFDYSDLFNSPTCGWWKIIGGKVDFDYSDLYNSPTCGWWKIIGGKVDFDYSDLYNSSTCGWWKIIGGKVDFDYSDLYNSSTCGWWKIIGGKVDFDYSDLYNSSTCGWWKIIGGKVDFDYSDLYNSSTCGWWKIHGGSVDFGYNGWYNSPQYGWWNIAGGSVVF